MSGVEYPVGTVAIATVRGVPGVRVMRAHPGLGGPLGWRSVAVIGHVACFHNDYRVTDIRPLPVINYEDREQVKRLLTAMDETFAPDDEPRDDWPETLPRMQAALREFAKPTPVKPEEPTGLGAVVEDAEGKRFVRQVDGWWRGDEPCSLNWPAITAVRVLSEGVRTDG